MNLLRDLKTSYETMGRIFAAGFNFHTIEQPDNHDLPGHSSVPCGTYTLVPHISGRLHEDDGVTPLRTWALVNPDLGITHAPTDPIPADCPYPHRSECLIHPANYAWQLEGCIAPGDGVAQPRGSQEWMVTNSRLAFKQIRQYLDAHPEDRTLVIEDKI